MTVQWPPPPLWPSSPPPVTPLDGSSLPVSERERDDCEHSKTNVKKCRPEGSIISLDLDGDSVILQSGANIIFRVSRKFLSENGNLFPDENFQIDENFTVYNIHLQEIWFVFSKNSKFNRGKKFVFF